MSAESTPAPAPRKRSRQALGLPAGSVRAILTFVVLGVCWLLVLFSPLVGDVRKVPMIFIYLQFLMILIIGHYFTSRHTPVPEGERAALGLPRGTVRFLILVIYGGLAFYLFYQNKELAYDFKLTGNQVLAVGLLFLGFILGHYFTLIALWWMKPIGEVPAWILDVQAWLALLALGGLLIVAVIHLVINPGVTHKIPTESFEAGLAAIVGFYFGARS